MVLTKAKEETTFEEALKDLETIVEKMERGDLSLDDALKSFEKGMVLAKLCEQKLGEAEGKVEKLIKENASKLSEGGSE